MNENDIYSTVVTARPPQPNKCCGGLGWKFDFKTGEISCVKCGKVSEQRNPRDS